MNFIDFHFAVKEILRVRIIGVIVRDENHPHHEIASVINSSATAVAKLNIYTNNLKMKCSEVQYRKPKTLFFKDKIKPIQLACRTNCTQLVTHNLKTPFIGRNVVTVEIIKLTKLIPKLHPNPTTQTCHTWTNRSKAPTPSYNMYDKIGVNAARWENFAHQRAFWLLWAKVKLSGSTLVFPQIENFLQNNRFEVEGKSELRKPVYAEEEQQTLIMCFWSMGPIFCKAKLH